MLEIATSTTCPVRKLTRRTYAIWRWVNNVYDIGAIKRTTSAGYFNLDFFARNCMSNKYHCTKVARYEVAAMSDFLNGGGEAIPHCQCNAFCRILLVSPS
jgi:hypothetical protein